MKKPLNVLTLFVLSVLLYCALTINMAQAKTHKHHHHVQHHTTHHHKKSSHSSNSSSIKTAQRHLINLGYLTGHADGVFGTKTKKALIRFQKEHGLAASGKLTTPTYNALVAADMGLISPPGIPLATAAVPDFYASNPDSYGHYNQQYENAMMLAPHVSDNGGISTISNQTLQSRYAKIDVSENAQDGNNTYTVTTNGQLLLQSVGQPAVIGISRTFELANEDAIIFTAFRPSDPVCTFKHYLYTVRANGQNIQEIGNCTRGFQGQITNNSLYIIFPETDDGRNVASTWRYEEGDLEHL